MLNAWKVCSISIYILINNNSSSTCDNYLGIGYALCTFHISYCITPNRGAVQPMQLFRSS